MLTGVHFLLTYTCLYQCDHCFLYCGPRAEGTFTLDRLRQVLDQAVELGGVRSVYFEGGEPFLFYPLLVEGTRMARERGFEVGVVTNAYWSTGDEDARLWLEPLGRLGLSDLSLSEDEFHGTPEGPGPAAMARTAAEALGIPAGTICIEPPQVCAPQFDDGAVVGGSVMLRGRAAETLAADLPRQPSGRFTECPHEELRSPGRVHVDPFGLVHLCQGLVIGSLWQQPLRQLLEAFEPDRHPITGPLLRGGPAALAAEHGVELDPAGYVDACHLCYSVRRSLVDAFADHLAPRQVYGLS